MNASIEYATETFTHKCAQCEELDGMNDGSFPFEDCTHGPNGGAGGEVVTVVSATVFMDGADCGTQRFYSYHGKNPQADAEAHFAPLLALAH